MNTENTQEKQETASLSGISEEVLSKVTATAGEENPTSKPTRISRKTLIVGILLLAAIVLLTFRTILKNLSGKDILAILKTVSPLVIIACLGMMLMFSFFEGLNMFRTLKLAGYKVTIFQCWRYAIVGFFYSGITPSSSGGQPMQIFYMYQDGISVSHGLAAVIMQLVGHEGANFLFALIAFLSMHSVIKDAIGNWQYLTIFGIVLNMLYFLFLMVCIFSRRGISIINSVLARIVRIFDKTGTSPMAQKILHVLDDYAGISDILTNDRFIAIKTILTGLAQFVCLYSIPAILYFGFGYRDFHFLQVELLQAVIFTSVGFIPLPGSAGISEALTVKMFRILYPTAVLGSAVLLGRCMSMYFVILFYGAILLIYRVVKIRHRQKSH